MLRTTILRNIWESKETYKQTLQHIDSAISINPKAYTCPDYYKIERNGETLYRKFTTRTCVLIPIEIDRLEYLIKYCVKNYYIKHANQVPDGEFIHKWRYESYQNEYKNRSSKINDLQNKLATIQRIADHG